MSQGKEQQEKRNTQDTEMCLKVKNNKKKVKSNKKIKEQNPHPTRVSGPGP